MINWLAVIGVATSIIAICLLALIGGLIFVAWKLKSSVQTSINKLESLLGQLERMAARVERRVAGIDDFVTSTQEKVSSLASKVRGGIQWILEGLHIAKRKDKKADQDIDNEEDESYEDEDYASYEYDRRPGNTWEDDGKTSRPRRKSR